jgi:hypothetical protein
MQITALGLAIKFIPAELQPVQSFINGIERRLRVALDVGVVDAQDHRALIVTHVEPVENKCPRAADMKITGGGGSKSHSQHGKS